MLWSDPEDIEGFQVVPKGAGYNFGGDVVRAFNYVNGMKMVCRSHQLVMEGMKWMFDGGLVIVWSVPNYAYRCGNKAMIMIIENDHEQFIEIPLKSANHPSSFSRICSYFL